MKNELQEQHVMVLENTHSSGAEEWHCPTCGRRILMQWPPNYKKVTLEAGDEYAVHSIAKGGFQMNKMEIKPAEMEQDLDIPSESYVRGDHSADQYEDYILGEEDKASLAFWEKWLKKSDFDSLWM